MSAGQAPRLFGVSPDGEAVHLVTLENGGTRAELMTWGASLRDFRLSGIGHPLVLGSPVLDPYFTVMRHYGAIAGRVANRIAKGRATLDGKEIELERNDKGWSTLHGGTGGCGVSNWVLQGVDGAACRMSIRMPDGQGGFPGNLDLAATYRLEEDGALTLEIEGWTDAPTFCNPAHHSYWNLNGGQDIRAHRMAVFADCYLPVDDAKIPLGSPEPVDGSRYDFRRTRAVASPGDAPLDHNFCLRDPGGEALRPACVLEVPDGVRLSISTTEPGLQAYDGSNIATAPAVGLSGRPYGAMAGLALEPQRWPDAPNHTDYPSVLLLPGQVYRQVSRFHAQASGAYSH